MPEIKNWDKLNFKSWNDISYKDESVSSFFGKTYFYYDKDAQKLFSKTFTIIERFLHVVFGYKSEYNRENFWQFLQSKKIVAGECPAKDRYRQIVQDRLGALYRDKASYFDEMINGKASEDELIEKFKNGLDVNCVNSTQYFDKGATALWEACYRKKYKVAKYLIENGANVNVGYNGGYVADTPFHALLSEGNLDLALFMVGHGLDLNHKNDKGQTPLHLAVLHCNLQNRNTKPIIEALLAKNPDINAVDKEGKTPLCYACDKREGNSLELVQCLAEHGANINVYVRYGNTPLNLACKANNVAVARYLFEKGASITPPKDPPADFGSQREIVYPPLVEAITYREPNMELIDLLLEKGADSNQGGGEGGNQFFALSKAASTGCTELGAYLIEKGAKVDTADEYGRTALGKLFIYHEAKSQQNSIKFAKLLLDKGANPNITPNFDSPYLHQIIANGKKDMLELFLSCPRTQVDILNKSGRLNEINWTPLHLAVFKGEEDMVRMLLARGANPASLDRSGKTPADLAKQLGHSNIAALFA